MLKQSIALFSIFLASCSMHPKAPVGSFQEDHIAVLKYLPCDAVGSYEPFDVIPTHFLCSSGKWNEVTLRLENNGEGQTKRLTLHWRYYTDDWSMMAESNETVEPYVDFVTQRYGYDKKQQLLELLEENEEGRMNIRHLSFDHQVAPIRNNGTPFDQHSLVIYAR